ncbi:MAG: hypothetical protein OCD01_15495 [Fibrobacterales bacterium]
MKMHTQTDIQLSIFDSPKVTPTSKVIPIEEEPTEIEFQYSKRMKQSWKGLKSGDSYIVRVPAIVQNGPVSLRHKFKEWSLLCYKRGGKKSIRRRTLEREIFTELENLFRIQGNPLKTSKRKIRITQGVSHNLITLFDEVNSEYFSGTLSADIGWASRVGGTSYHTTKIGSDGKPYHFISISKGYDHQNCPNYAIKGVIYHEMLHIAIPPTITPTGRRVVHSKMFRDAEKKYRFYSEWIEWHAITLRKNLAVLKRAKTIKKRGRLRTLLGSFSLTNNKTSN